MRLWQALAFNNHYVGQAWARNKTAARKLIVANFGPGKYRIYAVDEKQRTGHAVTEQARNPAKSLTLRNMASVTIKRLPGGAVAVTGRKLNGARRKR